MCFRKALLRETSWEHQVRGLLQKPREGWCRRDQVLALLSLGYFLCKIGVLYLTVREYIDLTIK